MADKTLKSLNFGGADNYFPLPLVTAADNDKILSVVNGEWAAAEAPSGGGGSGQYVWSKQFAGSTATEDTTGGTYTLTTADSSKPSSEIEYSASAPTYNPTTKKWEMSGSTVVTLTNTDNTVPSFSGNMYVRLTSAPNVWYLATAINVGGSGPYTKSLAYNAMYTAAIDNSYVEYVTGETEADYPDDGWSEGAYFKGFRTYPVGGYWIKNKTSPFANLNSNSYLHSFSYNNELLVAGTNSKGLYYSTDGKTWIQSNITSGTFYSVHYSNGLFVAGSGNGRGFYYSTDGKTWTQSNITSGYGMCAYYYNDLWVYASTNGGLYYSTDGKTWTQSNITSNSFYSVCGANGKWIAGSGSSKGLYYSTNGKTWTQSNITNGYVYNIYYLNGLWITSNGNGLYYSTDGKTWTQSNVTSGYAISVIYANGLFVSHSNSTGLYYSTDGKTWTQSNITNGSFYSLYHYDGLFVAGGSGPGLYYSTDGMTWAQSNVVGGSFLYIYCMNGVWITCGLEFYYSDKQGICQ